MLVETFKDKINAFPIDPWKEKLKGKTFSILSDGTSTSVSGTIDGVNIDGLAWSYATNSYPGTALNKIWWYPLVSELGMELLVNNSWGGGRTITNIGDFTSDHQHKDGTNEGNSCCHLRELRRLGIWSKNSWKGGHVVKAPDYIIIRIGINDFIGMNGSGILDSAGNTIVTTQEAPLGYYYGQYPIEELFPSEYLNIEYKHDFAIKEKTDPLLKVFSNAYALTLCRLHAMYPKAKIYCCTINPIDMNGNKGNRPEMNDGTLNGSSYAYRAESLESFNNRIRQLCHAFSCKTIEHAQCGITYGNLTSTLSGNSTNGWANQNNTGAALMGKEAVKALLSN